jgi:hypothetical protein
MTDVFWPGWRATAAVGLLAVSAIGYAAALRFLAIEDSTVALACDAGRMTWPCGSRKIALAFSQSSAFGALALGAALLNLVRPSVILAGLALGVAGFGLVLYNTAPSAVAVALVALSLARPRPEPE